MVEFLEDIEGGAYSCDQWGNTGDIGLLPIIDAGSTSSGENSTAPNPHHLFFGSEGGGWPSKKIFDKYGYEIYSSQIEDALSAEYTPSPGEPLLGQQNPIDCPELIYGCMDPAACNYNSDANIESIEDACIYLEDGSDCNDDGLSLNGDIIPKEYILQNIYPNPFNPIATISFSISAYGLTSITVYNIQGRKIDTLTNEFFHIGSYSILWNASNYSSGIYIIKMESGNFIKTQKVFLIK